ncbi:MAG: hypothetical protein RBU37_00675 [Myxococcota bacterium]|jgi:hypothetical protein|nr:hypothetical protein [Myxococcota bacterium]
MSLSLPILAASLLFAFAVVYRSRGATGHALALLAALGLGVGVAMPLSRARIVLDAQLSLELGYGIATVFIALLLSLAALLWPSKPSRKEKSDESASQARAARSRPWRLPLLRGVAVLLVLLLCHWADPFLQREELRTTYLLVNMYRLARLIPEDSESTPPKRAEACPPCSCSHPRPRPACPPPRACPAPSPLPLPAVDLDGILQGKVSSRNVLQGGHSTQSRTLQIWNLSEPDRHGVRVGCAQAQQSPAPARVNSFFPEALSDDAIYLLIMRSWLDNARCQQGSCTVLTPQGFHLKLDYDRNRNLIHTAAPLMESAPPLRCLDAN